MDEFFADIPSQKSVVKSEDGSVDADVQLDNEGPCHLDFDAGPGRWESTWKTWKGTKIGGSPKVFDVLW